LTHLDSIAPEDTDPVAFLEKAQRNDPERYAELEARFPISTEMDDFRFANGEPRKRTLKRRGLSGGVPRSMRRRLTDEDRAAMREGERELRLTYALAQELAQQGM
jgi:hypothetical protein